MTQTRRIIAIAGAGIAGLTAAIFLERAGFHVRIVERNEGPQLTGAGIQISPNAFKVLAEIGLGDALKTASAQPDCVDIRSGLTGKKLTRFELGETTLRRHGAPYLVLHRVDLANILLKACSRRKNIEIIYNQRAVDFNNRSDGATLVTKTGIGIEEHQASAVIGADGVWSALRQHVLDASIPTFNGRIAWRALLPMTSVSDYFPKQSTGLWLGPKVHLVHYPVRLGKWLNVVAITPIQNNEPSVPRRWIDDQSQSSLLETFKAWHPEVKQLISQAPYWGGWPLHSVARMNACAAAHLCLIGDAAHATEPYAAQGGGCAIEDAAVLGKLCHEHADALDLAFKKFETQRKTRVNRVLDLAQSNRKIYHLTGPLSIARNFAMRHMPQEMVQKRMDWLYGWTVPDN